MTIKTKSGKVYKRSRLMTHAVLGYPDMEKCVEIIKNLITSGADMLELQIPFSDPLADGPTITSASETALANGGDVEACFRLILEVRELSRIPIYLMTYLNIPFVFGSEKFLGRCALAGVNGLIIPDLPFDEHMSGFREKAKELGINMVSVISENITDERLSGAITASSGFLYLTRRLGITGAGKNSDPEGLDFFKRVRQITDLPLALGFGISSIEHADELRNHADIIIIGSHLIDLYNSDGLQPVNTFIENLNHNQIIW